MLLNQSLRLRAHLVRSFAAISPLRVVHSLMSQLNLRRSITLPRGCPPLPQHLLERVRLLNYDKAVDGALPFVLCWLHHAYRDHDNACLDVALSIGNALNRPVLVYAGLGGAHKYNSDRSHTFIMEGARCLATSLHRRNIAFAFNLQVQPSNRSPLRILASQACCVVTEDFPAPPMPKWTKK